MKSAASFSPCKEYRWSLTKFLSNSEKELVFIGLNPSTGTANVNDRTICRLISFAESWSYGSLKIINLFAKISNKPSILKSCNDPIGPKNDCVLRNSICYWSKSSQCDLWLGWGVNGELMTRNYTVLKLIKKTSSKRPLVIGLTKNGHPLHPLYVSKKKILYPLSKLITKS